MKSIRGIAGVVIAGIAVLAPVTAQAKELTIYNGALENGWQSWSWAKINLANKKPVHNSVTSISINDPKGWGALLVHHMSPISVQGYRALSFWAYGSGGQQLQVGATENGKASGTAVPLGSLPARKWQQYVVPLSKLRVAGKTNVDGFEIQNATGKPMKGVYVDNIVLMK